MMGYVTAAYAVVLGGFLLYWWTLKARMDALLEEQKKLQAPKGGDSP